MDITIRKNYVRIAKRAENGEEKHREEPVSILISGYGLATCLYGILCIWTCF